MKIINIEIDFNFLSNLFIDFMLFIFKSKIQHNIKYYNFKFIIYIKYISVLVEVIFINFIYHYISYTSSGFIKI